MTRWRTFLIDKVLQHSLRAVCRALAAVARAPYAIYLPDSGFSVSEALELVGSSKTIDEIRGFLAAYYGPPASHGAAIYERDEGDWRSGNGFLIELFKEQA